MRGIGWKRIVKRVLETIPDVNWRLVERGEDLYMDRCTRCHGRFGRPPWEDSSTPPPPDLSKRAFQQRTTDDELVRSVRHGRPAMPADSHAATVAWVVEQFLPVRIQMEAGQPTRVRISPEPEARAPRRGADLRDARLPRTSTQRR